MFQRILCAVDGSENSDRAVSAAAELAAKTGGAVVLMTAYHIPEDLSGLADHVAADGSYIQRIRAAQVAEAEELLDRHRQTLSVRGVEVETSHQEGRPGPTILGALDDLGCDCAVVGRRGLGGVRRVLLGSVSDFVVHHADKPVLVVP